MKTQITIIAFVLASVTLQATEPGTVIVKNSGAAPMQVWVNGHYQGYLRPGETRHSVSDGFHDGSKASHGGWANNSKEQVAITYQFPGGEKTKANVSINVRGEAIFGATNKDGQKPKLPTEEERENAAPIIKGTLPHLSDRVGKEDENTEAPTVRPFVGTWTGVREFAVGNPETMTVVIQNDGSVTEEYESVRGFKGKVELNANNSITFNGWSWRLKNGQLQTFPREDGSIYITLSRGK